MSFYLSDIKEQVILGFIIITQDNQGYATRICLIHNFFFSGNINKKHP